MIWTLFKEGNDHETAQCNLCSKSIKHCGGTKNLWQHLERHHKIEHKKLRDVEDNEIKKASIPSCSTGSASKTKRPITTDLGTTTAVKRQAMGLSTFLLKPISESHLKSMIDGLMYLVTKDIKPLSIGEDKGFIEYSRRLNPQYHLPSRKTLSSWIEGKVKEVKADINEEIKNLERLSVICDMWTSRAIEDYITVTAHGINAEFQMINVVLDTVCMHTSHRGDNQADTVMKVLDEWGLKGKVYAVVTDNASSAVKCVSKLIRKGYAEKHVRCCAHTLQLCVNDMLKCSDDVAQMLKRCKDTVSLFHHSVVLSESLKDAQTKLKVTSRKLKQAVPTRWNSTYEMLARLVDQQKTVQLAFCAYTSKVATARPSNCVTAKQLID
jgi:hypothetical protein